jgi:hypothetical protein
MIEHLRTKLKTTLIILTVMVQTFVPVGFSRTVLADEAAAGDTAAATSLAPTCPVVTGTLAPTGVAAHTFVFVPAPACYWENDYYTWSPVTKVYTPKYDTYVCDGAGVCENVNWRYVSADGLYVETRTVVSTPTTSTTTATTPTSSAATAGGSVGTTDQSTGSSIVSGNGTDSNNTIANDTTATGNFDLTNNASVLTTLNSDATTGDANALFNTTVGDVSTGDAAAIANVLNMIQSSWDPANGDITLFSADLYDNYFGDLLFDPSILLGNGTGSSNTIANNGATDLTINIEENASIQNDINLNAQSGDANANGNTDVGDVSTGDATAIANVINMINSMITTGDSFIGSINLYGDLNGDILLPQSLLDILLGNGTNSTNTIANNQSTDVDANVSTNSTITNNTNLTSTSGNATADANTTVGDISTGDAETSVNEMNLIGQNVQGTKGLLVFINVMGSWVGLLFNAPVTSSINGGNGTNSANTIANNASTDVDINVARNYSILNNLNLNATTGDATANANTTAGDVSTGNASTGVNLLNMIDSSMNFTDWFGVLFINVFGSWNGSFGTNTPAGNKPEENKGSGMANPEQPGVAGTSTENQTPKVFDFIPRTASTRVASALSDAVAAQTQTEGQTSSTQTEEQSGPTSTEQAITEAAKRGSFWLPATFGVLAVLLLFGERIVALVRRPNV